MNLLSLVLSGAAGLCAGALLFPAASRAAMVLACENECDEGVAYQASTKAAVTLAFAAICAALTARSQSAGIVVVGATLAWLLTLLALVDYQTLMLPDVITLPLIGVGILRIGWGGARL
ncbi:hypothetical protein [Pandoraea apista]|uniref:hypothetical protein n=1 Tax=Pandoraea apista TaxID=93218 RepID=UPI00072DBAD4|nr:hypothetical protein [Pandoraea apista]ALS68437.1 hypothetical protein AT395_25180 [Pandoraea apista]